MDYHADSDSDDDLPLPSFDAQAAQAGAASTETPAYDFAADLRLVDEIEDASSLPPESEAASAVVECGATHDFSADLQLTDCATPEPAATCSSLPPTPPRPDALELHSEPDIFVEPPLKTNDEFFQLRRSSLTAQPAAAAPSVEPTAPATSAAAASQVAIALSEQLAHAPSSGRSSKRPPRRTLGPRRRFAWLFHLETWLAIAALSLFFQVFPAAWWRTLAVVDVRNWTWGVWVSVEVVTVVVLFALCIRQRTWNA